MTTSRRRPGVSRNQLHILIALAKRDRHGFDIMRDVLEQTDGAVRLWPAALYGAIEALASDRLIEELTDASERPSGESERRRYYRITRAGRDTLAAEVGRLEKLARAARASLKPRRSEG